MKRAQLISAIVIGVVLAIGCGSKQDASATTGKHESSERPMQLAQTAATPTPAPSAQPSSTGGSASIKGTVAFQGTAPASPIVKMDADPVCQQQHSGPVRTEEVVVNQNGTLKNVFVYVKEGAKGPFSTPGAPVTLTQAGCWYSPHVFGIQANQPLEIVNSDPTLHNINAKPTKNQPFNVAQPTKGMKSTKKFTTPEIGVKFKCNVHPWMSAYAGVVDNPFFGVSDDAGTFTISGLPSGTYVLEAWHEKYGTQTQTVSVADGEAKSVQFTFKAQ